MVQPKGTFCLSNGLSNTDRGKSPFKKLKVCSHAPSLNEERKRIGTGVGRGGRGSLSGNWNGVLLGPHPQSKKKDTRSWKGAKRRVGETWKEKGGEGTDSRERRGGFPRR